MDILRVIRSSVLSCMLLSVPLYVGAQEQGQAAAEAAAAPAPATATAGAGASSAAFDLSLPVTVERCRMMSELNAYVDSLPAYDIEHLTAAKKFLEECQLVLQAQLEDTQQKLSELKKDSK